MQVLTVLCNFVLLNDLDLIADKRDREILCLSSCNDAHNHNCYAAAPETYLEYPSDIRDQSKESSDDAGDTFHDEKEDAVVNVISYKR